MLKQISKFAIPVVIMTLVLPFAGCGVSQDKYDELNSQLTSLQNEYNDAQSELASAQTEIDKLNADLTGQGAKLDQAQSSYDSLQKQASDLENKLNAILNTTATQYYRFTYKYVSYDWALPVPLRTYFYYKDLPRPTKYDTMVIDSYADNVMNILSQQVEDAALTNDMKPTDVINLVATFVRSLPHSDEDARTPFDGYPRYPVETLFDQGGDSEDNSILIASLLIRERYDVVFLLFQQPKHLAVGVNAPTAIGYRWEYQGNWYYYLEPNEKNWELGELPTPFRGTQPVIIPISH